MALLLTLGIPAMAAESPLPVRLTMDQRIEMPDGVGLVAKIWQPAEVTSPMPTVYALTPYIADEGQKWGPFFVRNGYVYVHVDARGRGNSEGEFYPTENEGRDGAEVARWIARQPWSNGQVAMRGGSYRGMVQWQILAEDPGSLATIVPTASGAPGIDFPWPGNIGVSYFAQWLGYTQGRTENKYLFGDAEFWQSRYYEMYSQHRPFADLARMSGSNTKVWDRWLAHRTYDEFWQNLTPAAADYRHFDIPILTITGHFDGDQPGAMSYYDMHMRHGTETARANHYLLIGPWSHAGTRKPTRELGSLVFGDNSVIDIDQLHVDWYDWVLKNGPRPGLLADRVTYYMMQENQWRAAPSLEAVSSATMSLFLGSGQGGAGDLFHSGTLETSADAGGGPDVFVNDPLYTISWAEYRAQSGAAEDMLGPDRLYYHSAPLTEGLDVAGFVELDLWLELDVPDTDLGVTLSEVRPDGTVIPLGSDMMRARFRNGTGRAELVRPGAIERYTFSGFYFFARSIVAGSRLRLTIGGLNSPNLEKNYNAGGDVANETAADARTATVRLHHGTDHPSVLRIPVAADGP
jgi:putative CocE/NonD family hydrolase